MTKKICLLIIWGVVISCQRNVSEFLSPNDGDLTILTVSLPEVSVYPYYLESEAQFLQGITSPKSDIVISLENSGSMDSHRSEVEESLLKISSIVKPYDHRIALVKSNSNNLGAIDSRIFGYSDKYSTPQESGSLPPPILGKEFAFVLLDFFNSYQGAVAKPYGNLMEAIRKPENSWFFRSDASKVFVVVSDGEDAVSADSFVRVLNDRTGQLPSTVLLVEPKDGCPREFPHLNLSAGILNRKGGASANLCSDFSDEFGGLFETITIPQSRFPLNFLGESVSSTNAKVFIDDKEVGSDNWGGGWQIQDGILFFKGGSVPRSGQKIFVEYSGVVR